MSVFKLKSPVFFNKKKSTLFRFSKSQVNRSEKHSDLYIRLYPTSFPRDGLYLYDFDLYKTQETHKKTRVHSLKNLDMILIGSMIC